MKAMNWSGADRTSWAKVQAMNKPRDKNMIDHISVSACWDHPKPMMRDRFPPMPAQSIAGAAAKAGVPMGNPAPQAGPQLMTVMVPEGATAGTMIQVQSPQGTLVQVSVPAGVAPGQTF